MKYAKELKTAKQWTSQPKQFKPSIQAKESLMKTKRFIATILGGIFLIGSMAGCSQASKAPVANGAGESGEVTVENSNFNPTGLPILNEKEKFTIVVEQTSQVVRAGDKPAVIKGENDTNIEIEWIEIPSSGWKEKVNIMFASNDLPDAFIGPINPEINYPQLAVLDDYIEDYAPSVKALFEARPGYKELLAGPDGKIHALAIGDESRPNLIDSMMWINQVWLDNLNLEVPTTTDEFYEVLKAFKTQDPNKNGTVGDEIPFTFGNIWGWATAIENVFGAFGVIENGSHSFVKDGKVIFSPEEQGYYDTLEYLNKLYSEGLIDPEALVHSADQYNAKRQELDKVGVFMEYRSNADDVFSHVPPLKGPNGDQLVGLNSIVRTEGFSITTACKNPEALVRWYDYVNSTPQLKLEWGRGERGSFWDFVDDKEENWWIIRDNKPEEYNNLAEWRTAVSFAGLTPGHYTMELDATQVPHPNDAPDTKAMAITEALPFGINGPSPVQKELEDSETLSLIRTDLDTYLTKFVADSIMNGIDSAKWDKHLATLKDLRTDEYREIYQKYEDKVNQ